MGALADLLRYPQAVATPATPATLLMNQASVSQESQESQGPAVETRQRLLTLAAHAGHLPAIVHRLHADDVAACMDEPDQVLTAYLRALDRGAVMDRGIAPADYTQPAHCDGCGPVWLWRGAPTRLLACPWCFRRKAGKAFPRPAVTCGNCTHYLPDRLNPLAGVGGCRAETGLSRWPMAQHCCAAHVPTDRNEGGEPA